MLCIIIKVYFFSSRQILSTIHSVEVLLVETDLQRLDYRITPEGIFQLTRKLYQSYLWLFNIFSAWLDIFAILFLTYPPILITYVPFLLTSRLFLGHNTTSKQALLSSDLILYHPDWDAEFHVHTDASKHRCGAMLTQMHNGILRLIKRNIVGLLLTKKYLLLNGLLNVFVHNLLAKNGSSQCPSGWPDVTFRDIYLYLIHTPESSLVNNGKVINLLMFTSKYHILISCWISFCTYSDPIQEFSLTDSCNEVVFPTFRSDTIFEIKSTFLSLNRYIVSGQVQKIHDDIWICHLLASI